MVSSTQVFPEKFGTKYESAIATGSIEDPSAAEKRAGLVLLVRKYSPDCVQAMLEYIAKLIGTTKVFRIRLESITGKARQ